jgi:hypothetical protein
MGQTEGYLRTVGKVLDDGVDIRSYARVRDSDDDFRLKAAMANVIEDAALPGLPGFQEEAII